MKDACGKGRVRSRYKLVPSNSIGLPWRVFYAFCGHKLGAERAWLWNLHMQLVLGPPHSIRRALGSPHATRRVLGPPCSIRRVLGSPHSTRRVLGPPCFTSRALGPPCSTRRAMRHPCSTRRALLSPAPNPLSGRSICS